MKEQYYLGIDVGGTKIAGGLICANGRILARKKCPAPNHCSSHTTLETIRTLIQSLLKDNNTRITRIRALGIGLPGIINAQRGLVIATPNAHLEGVNIRKEIHRLIKIPVAIDNDVNLGLLGEKWLGAARRVHNVIGIFPGTGIGGAIIINDQLIRGTHGGAAEFGHMIVDPHGPKCHCGNYGCLEAFAGRWAIERDIRSALRAGHKSIITQRAQAPRTPFKSKLISEALHKKDVVVTTIMKQAMTRLGHSCISLRHIFDPEMIVLGGGLVEACADFIVPIIERHMARDPFFGKVANCVIAESVLRDDAVLLGAVAYAQQSLGINPFTAVHPLSMTMTKKGTLVINKAPVKNDIVIRADGTIKKRKPEKQSMPLTVTPGELERICKRSPRILFIGVRNKKPLTLTRESRAFLRHKSITCIIQPLFKAIRLFLACPKRKALVIQYGKNK